MTLPATHGVPVLHAIINFFDVSELVVSKISGSPARLFDPFGFRERSGRPVAFMCTSLI